MSSTMTSAEIEQLSVEIQRVSPAFIRLREHLADAVRARGPRPARLRLVVDRRPHVGEEGRAPGGAVEVDL
ncbi:MAG: hypothetical protein QF351_03270, partial [Phycisphaerales bacterium]|nr:hypothetical protein [Phycisphaerales bacterium]